MTVDERGQMVLPKELREKAGIKAGDKLAVTSWEKDGEVCCIALIKAGSLETMVKGMLGPLMKDLERAVGPLLHAPFGGQVFSVTAR